MNNMTTEEKTSCYDEAIYNNYKSFTVLIERLESVKSAIKEHNYGIAMDILYKPYPDFQVTTHPELKESEDERIREALIEYFRWNVKQILSDFDNKEVLAWLEKQGEHANFRNKIQIGDKVTRNRDGVLVNLSQLNRVAKKDERQGENFPILSNSSNIGKGEQKPAWSEEDDIMVHDIDYALRCQIAYPKPRLNSMSSWIYELKNRIQPKPKWKPSDEQLEYLLTIKTLSPSPLLESLYVDLKKLREE